MFRRQNIKTLLRESAEEHAAGKGLHKVLTVTDLVAFGISSTLGSGIFVTVGTIAAQYAGPGIFLSFLVAGFGSMLSALCYAEFASRIPLSGQGYTYAYVALGEVVAFVNGWLGFVSYCVATAAVARGWASYVDCFFLAIPSPVTLPRWMVNAPIDGFGGIMAFSGLAALLNIACMTMACFGISESTRLSLILVIVNFSLMVGFVIYGSWSYGDVDRLEPLMPFGVLGVLKGSGLAFFCCIGWELVCALGEEVKRPSRDLPRGIIGSLSATTALYCAVCIALAVMVPWQQISIGAPIADAFRFNGDNFGYILVSFVCTMVCPPSVLAGIIGPPRILYKMARDGLVFEWLGRVNAKGAPVTATLVGGCFASVLAGVFNFESLAGTCSSSTLFMFALVCFGVLIVRAREAGAVENQGKLTIALMVFAVFSFFFCALLIHGGNVAWLIVAGILNIGSAGFAVHTYNVVSTPSIDPKTNPLLREGFPASHDSILITSVKSAKKRHDIFLCPLMPFLPLLAAWVDIFMIASLGPTAAVGLLGMLVSGMFVYFAYGIHNSKLAQ
jgi:basic amino acid/polyamine antiporter, APA family